MANKYVDTTLVTGNNDGTSLADAWQNLLTVMTGTVPNGSIDAGDVIYVRGGNSGTPLTQAVSSNLTMNNVGTIDNPVTWVFDDGTIWSGDDAGFRITFSGSSAKLDSSAYNNIQGNDLLEIYSTDTAVANRHGWFIAGVWCVMDGVKFIADCPNSGYGRSILLSPKTLDSSTIKVNFNNCTFGPFGNSDVYLFSMDGNRTAAECSFTNCTIDTNNRTYSPIIKGGNGSSKGILHMENCSFINTNPSSRLAFINDGTDNLQLTAKNCLFDLIPLGINIKETTTQNVSKIVMNNPNLVKRDFYYETAGGFVQWQAGANYPTLDSVLPDGTPWSWRVLPNPYNSMLSKQVPLTFPPTIKTYTGTTGQKVITAEFLLKDTFSTPTSDDIYFNVFYIDSTGVARQERSTSVTTSTAGWSSVFYGAQNYVKYKATLTTSYNVEDDSEVEFVMNMSMSGSTESDFMFFSPEVSIQDV